MNPFPERIDALVHEGVFLGGPRHLFEVAGRRLLVTLLLNGLLPNSKVLDVGCGCLRGGYWLLHFLGEGCYFGIEPNTRMLDAGVRILVEPNLMHAKTPAFDHNSDFNFSVFGVKFDYVVARSIWTHASKAQIRTMLDEFLNSTNEGGVFITSHLEPTNNLPEYQGESWIGRNDFSDRPGLAHHSLRWIEIECARRGLQVKEIDEPSCNFGGQQWIKIVRR